MVIENDVFKDGHFCVEEQRILGVKMPGFDVRCGVSPDNLIPEICACCQVVIVPRSHRLLECLWDGTTVPYRGISLQYVSSSIVVVCADVFKYKWASHQRIHAQS